MIPAGHPHGGPYHFTGWKPAPQLKNRRNPPCCESWLEMVGTAHPTSLSPWTCYTNTESAVFMQLSFHAQGQQGLVVALGEVLRERHQLVHHTVDDVLGVGDVLAGTA